jgi:hypothetical protein
VVLTGIWDQEPRCGEIDSLLAEIEERFLTPQTPFGMTTTICGGYDVGPSQNDSQTKRALRKAAVTLAQSLRDELVGFGYAYVFVAAAVVEEEAVGLPQHSFDEDNVGNLTHFFPFELRLEKGLI